MRAGLIVALGLAVFGCDLFRPATPDPPAGGNGFVPNYSSVEAALATLSRAIELRNRQDAYMDGFAHSSTDPNLSYRALTDPADIAELPAGTQIPDPWDYDLERTFYSHIVQVPIDTVFFMRLEKTLTDSLGLDQSRVHRFYTLYSGFATGDTAARGIADIRFIRVGQEWRVLLWIDRRDPAANPTVHTFGWNRIVSAQ
jgi:hypothetical protein